MLTTAFYGGPVTVCVTAFGVDDPEDFAKLRILHREGNQNFDRTILAPDMPGPSFSTRQVCARVENPNNFYLAFGPTYQAGGRVLTPSGLGVRNAVVTMTDYRGVRYTSTTSSFGVYSFDNARSGETYTITVSSKRYRFTPRTHVANANAADLDFVGLE